MTIEAFRPGVEKPMELPEGTLFEVKEASGSRSVLLSLRAREGFKDYTELDLPAFEVQDIDAREEAEKNALVYKEGALLQLADGIIVKAT